MIVSNESCTFGSCYLLPFFRSRSRGNRVILNDQVFQTSLLMSAYFRLAQLTQTELDNAIHDPSAHVKEALVSGPREDILSSIQECMSSALVLHIISRESIEPGKITNLLCLDAPFCSHQLFADMRHRARYLGYDVNNSPSSECIYMYDPKTLPPGSHACGLVFSSKQAAPPKIALLLNLLTGIESSIALGDPTANTSQPLALFTQCQRGIVRRATTAATNRHRLNPKVY